MKIGDVIQINKNCISPDWIGCIMCVREVKEWGVLAYMKIPHSGTTFLKLKNNEFDYVGEATLTLEPYV